MNPDIYYYNPTCELAVANNSENFHANALLRKFEYDLDLLPAFLARPNDITLVNKIPSKQFQDRLINAGFQISRQQLLGESLTDQAFIDHPKGYLRPWGWSPAVHKLLAPLKDSCDPEFRNSAVAQWRPVHRELYSRKQGVELIKSIVTREQYAWMPQIEDLPQLCTSHEEIIHLQQKWGKIVVKSPWSSSGRGLQFLRLGEYNQSNRQVISGFLNQQGYVVVEPFYNKKLDLSFQFYSDGNGSVEYKGITTFLAEKSGRYTGSYIEEIPENISGKLKDFYSEHLTFITNLLKDALNHSPYSTEYCGWIGVDSIICDTENENMLFHPCVEVNCRYTMGAVALALRHHLVEGSTGKFLIMHGKEGHFMKFCKEMESKEPLDINNGKIVKGFLALTPPSNDSLFGAYIIVSD
jgi:hypothetical protein